MQAEIDRVISFSVQPADKETQAKIKKIKEHCSKTGISFSFLMIKSINHIVEELKL